MSRRLRHGRTGWHIPIALKEEQPINRICSTLCVPDRARGHWPVDCLHTATVDTDPAKYEAMHVPAQCRIIYKTPSYLFVYTYEPAEVPTPHPQVSVAV